MAAFSGLAWLLSAPRLASW